MKAVIQRVTNAKVLVNGEVISEIGRGLCILVGICQNDTEEDIKFLSQKILKLRLFEEGGKRWQKSVKDLNLEILCVSQFTLYYRLKGNKPDFHNAMGGDQAKKMYDQFLNLLRSDHNSEKIKDGIFGAMMNVQIHNDGPVTIELESSSVSKNLLEKEFE